MGGVALGHNCACSGGLVGFVYIFFFSVVAAFLLFLYPIPLLDVGQGYRGFGRCPTLVL